MKLCLQGAEIAYQAYAKWCGDKTVRLDRVTPESFLQIRIAQLIRKKLGCMVTLEEKKSELLNDAKPESQQDTRRLPKSNPKTDIMLWKAKDEPTVAIEIKRNVDDRNLEKVKEDAKRIETLMKHFTTIQFGVVVVGFRKEYEKEINCWIKEVIAKIEPAKSIFSKRMMNADGGKNKVKVGCFLIER